MKIKVKDGIGYAGVTEHENEHGISEFVATDELPAFLPDGTVCSDGEYYGEIVEQYYYNLVTDAFWIDCPEWMIELDKSTWTEHQSRQIYRCQSPTIQSPADKYIKALEGLKKVDMTGWAITYVNVHNNAIDEAIKTIREL